MSSTFTPSQAVDMSKEKDWPVHLGMLDWDSTKIVFTKRSLVEFLKYAGITIDPGFTNIQKLPRYAQFGNMVANPDAEETTTDGEGITSPASPVQSAVSSGNQRLLGEEPSGDVPRATVTPPQRVRTVPGGTSSIGSIFSDDSTEQFVPTRRVRQRPGGEDNIEGLF